MCCRTLSSSAVRSTAGLTADYFGIFCEVHERLMAVRRKFALQLRRDGDEFLLVTLAPGASTASARGQVTVKMLVVRGMQKGGIWPCRC